MRRVAAKARGQPQRDRATYRARQHAADRLADHSGQAGPLPRELAAAAILGHRKGAFTGASADRVGCFEQADRGTLFIDEIGELSLDLQPKLLRVLDRNEIQRVGEHAVRSVDVRVVAATHRDLRALVAEQPFRLDLLHRIAQVTVRVPPLRERPDDIELLARHFARTVALRSGHEVTLDDEALAHLRELYWEATCGSFGMRSSARATSLRRIGSVHAIWCSTRNRAQHRDTKNPCSRCR